MAAGMNDHPTGRDFGNLEGRVRALDSKFGELNDKMDKLSAKLDDLTRLAERGRGAYWAALGMASAIGAVIAWGIKLFPGNTPAP
jgi:hypothetical protein